MNVPTPDLVGSELYSDVGLSVPADDEIELRRLTISNKLNAGGRKDVDRGATVDGAHVDIFRQVVDGAVALILQRRGRRVGRAQALKLGVDRRDLLQVGVDLRHRVADVLVDVGAQRLDALRRRVDLLRQCLRRAQRRRLCRQSGRVGLERLDGRGEIVEGRFQRAGASGRAVDALQLPEDIRDLVGIAGAAGLGTQLPLNELIEVTGNARDQHRGAGAAARHLDLIDGLGGVAGRIRVGDIRRRNRKRGLVGTQAGYRTGKGRTQTHLYPPCIRSRRKKAGADQRNTFSKL